MPSSHENSTNDPIFRLNIRMHHYRELPKWLLPTSTTQSKTLTCKLFKFFKLIEFDEYYRAICYRRSWFFAYANGEGDDTNLRYFIVSLRMVFGETTQETIHPGSSSRESSVIWDNTSRVLPIAGDFGCIRVISSRHHCCWKPQLFVQKPDCRGQPGNL